MSERLVAAALLPLLASGCLAPGKRDPTRYPWDQPRVHAAAPANGEYCVLSLENPAANGIVARGQVPTFEQLPPQVGKVVHLPCTMAPQPRP